MSVFTLPWLLVASTVLVIISESCVIALIGNFKASDLFRQDIIDIPLLDVLTPADLNLPLAGEDRKIKYDLYTLRNKDIPVAIEHDTTPQSTTWDTNQRVIFFIHGYIQTANNEVLFAPLQTSIQVKNAFMEMNRVENIVLVDWGSYAIKLDYRVAAENTHIVGNSVADFIISLRNRNFISNYDMVEIVGFSLGAQIAGIAGDQLKSKTKEQVARIVGLDPAGPGFDSPSLDLKDRLDPSDAKFVEVMHCNMGKLFAVTKTDQLADLVQIAKFGTTLISGHVDFFPNGGSSQPGCVIPACSHMRSPELYIQTLRGKQYRGCQCDSWISFNKGFCSRNCDGPLMGDPTPSNATGIYYLRAEL